MKKLLSAVFMVFCIPGLYAQQRNLHGNVMDENDGPLPGVTIILSNDRTSGTVTDEDGSFTLKASVGDTLTFSCLGYEDLVMPVNGFRNGKIVMESSLFTIDELVVIGYGTSKKSDLTGSVAVVKTQDISNIPVMRVDQMLQGRIAGVDVMSVSGEPGEGTSIRVRGTRSIMASNEPLYVIDGVVDAATSLSDINPNDIQSMQVLKDASATAIYGSRAANGVIIITTKMGQEGKPKFSFKADFGFAQLPKYLDVMNATEYAIFYNDYKSMPNSLLSPPSGYPLDENGAPMLPLEDMFYPDPLSMGDGTNWVKEVTRIAPYQNYALNGAGGTKDTRYYFSVSFNDTRGIIDNSGIKKIQGRLNLDQNLGKKVKLGLRFNYNYSDADKNAIELGTITSANVNAAISLTPTMPVYNEDNSYNGWNPVYGNGGYINSPVALADLTHNKHYIKSMITNAFLEYRPIKGMLLKSTFSYQNYSRNEERLLPSELPMRKFREQGAYASQRIAQYTNILNENTIGFKKKIGRHNLDLLYGFTYQYQKNTSLFVYGNGYSNDDTALWSLGSIPTKESLNVTTDFKETVTISNLARLNYNYDNRYYLTVTGRVDGSSNFAENHKWAFFPSAAVKWNIANEAFMKDIKQYFSDAALRLSYGITGNQGISAYASLAKMSPNSTNSFIFDGTIPSAFYVSSIYSPDLTWEKTTSYNIGIDLGFLKNRITVNFDLYYSLTKDLLLNVQTPSQIGFSSRVENVGSTSNKGYELTINTINFSRKNFYWATALTVSHNRQMVEDAGGYDRIATYTPNQYTYEMYGYKEGYPVNALWGMEFAGTWKTREEIEENKTSHEFVSKPGTFTDLGRSKYVDQNKDGVLDRNDIVYLGCSDPLVFGGIQNTFKIHGFNISFYFHYSLGGYIFNPLELSMGSGDNQTNQYRYMTNAWHPTRNPDSDIPRAGSKDFVVSTAQRHDASFLRLKDVSLGYTFDLSKATNYKLRALTLSMSGNNLYLWKYYNGFDPEVSSPNGTRRIDLGAYPNSRTIVMSVQLDF